MFVKLGKQRESRLFYIKNPEMLNFISYSQPGPLEARHHVPLQVPPEQEEEDPAVQQRGGRHGPKRNGVSWVVFVLFLLLEKSHEGKFISALDVGEVEKRKKTKPSCCRNSASMGYFFRLEQTLWKGMVLYNVRTQLYCAY